MKKLKASFDREAIQESLIQHAEKIVFGAIVICFVVIVFQALGRKPYQKTPAKLKEAAQEAESTWKDADTKPEVKFTNYVKKVDDIIHVPVNAGLYAHRTLWDDPLLDKRRPRGLPELCAVKELRGIAGYGRFAVVEKATSVRPKGRPARPGRPSLRKTFGGLRWVVVTGVVPKVEQSAAYLKHFENAQDYKPERDVVEYDSYEIRRAELTDPGGTEELTWKSIDPKVALTTIRERFGGSRRFPGGGSRDSATEVVQEKYIENETLVFLLGPLVEQYGTDSTGRPPESKEGSWRREEVGHPWLAGPPFDAVHEALMAGHNGQPTADNGQQDPFQGQQTTWQGVIHEVQGARVIYLAGADSDGTQAEQFFAVECLDENVASQQPEAGSVTGTVSDPATIEVVIEDPAGSLVTKRVKMPVLKYLEQEGEPEYRLFRFFDFDVKPGKRYRYQVSLRLKNPNYELDSSVVEKPEPGKPALWESEFIWTPWSQPTEAVSVPRDTRLLALSVAQPLSHHQGKKPSGRMMVIQWINQKGIEACTEFAVEPGAVANKLGCTFPETREATQPKQPKNGGRRLLRPKPKSDEDEPISVDYKSHAIVLDMQGGEPLPGKDQLAGPGEILLFDQDGNLVVHKELDDLADYRRTKGIEEAEDGAELGDTPASTRNGSTDSGMTDRDVLEQGPPEGRGRTRQPNWRIQR